MQIGIPRETRPGETRVAATPETVAKLVRLGHQLLVERAAGTSAGQTDTAYQQAGAQLVSAAEAFGAELVLKVVAPDSQELSLMQSGAVLMGMLDPFDLENLDRLAAHGVTAFALEAAPRTSRATKPFCWPWSITHASCRC